MIFYERDHALVVGAIGDNENMLRPRESSSAGGVVAMKSRSSSFGVMLAVGLFGLQT